MAIPVKDFREIKVGDRITFKLTWARYAVRKSTRLVTKVGIQTDRGSAVCVNRYEGWKDFYVYSYEILEVIKKGE